jgi:hypothetical protein
MSLCRALCRAAPSVGGGRRDRAWWGGRRWRAAGVGGGFVGWWWGWERATRRVGAVFRRGVDVVGVRGPKRRVGAVFRRGLDVVLPGGSKRRAPRPVLARTRRCAGFRQAAAWENGPTPSKPAVPRGRRCRLRPRDSAHAPLPSSRRAPTRSRRPTRLALAPTSPCGHGTNRPVARVDPSRRHDCSPARVRRPCPSPRFCASC